MIWIGYLWMIEQMESNLEGFDLNRLWQRDFYDWLRDFLDEQENTKLFVWIAGFDEEAILKFELSEPPRFYGKHPLAWTAIHSL